ncbi:MAG: hypothetical protein JKY02_04160 [Flavobacteriaceae bacterium]|nr:hypothetical protein [Flavobacteriaceae bacterium]
MKIKSTYIVLVFVLGAMHFSSAQSLLDKLNAEPLNGPLYTLATFKATRISIGHSVETRKKNVLEISVMSRFWNLHERTKNRFIADKISNRFGLDYGLSDRLTLGVGFSTLNNIFDTYLKYRLIQQQDNGPNKFSITLLQSAAHLNHKTPPSPGSKPYASISGNSFSDKLTLTSQVLIARKFTRNFSLQISPTFIRKNTAISPSDDQNQFAVGFGGRYKVANHVSIVSEYYYVTNPIKSFETHDAFAIGANWELSDLMLQFKMTNTPNFVEGVVLSQTRRPFNFKDGNFFFGFHATFFLQL